MGVAHRAPTASSWSWSPGAGVRGLDGEEAGVAAVGAGEQRR
ncbi:hypothetical protein [Streptomyces sp. NPDC002611]